MKIETARLVGLTEMEIVDGRLHGKEKATSTISLFDLKPSTGMEQAYKFFLKSNPDTEVCHIGITFQRDRFEVSYGVDNSDLLRQGYMIEALTGFVDFVKLETAEPEIWGLPNGPTSQHILEKCGFKYYGPVENSNSSWFLYRIT